MAGEAEHEEPLAGYSEERESNAPVDGDGSPGDSETDWGSLVEETEFDEDVDSDAPTDPESDAGESPSTPVKEEREASSHETDPKAAEGKQQDDPATPTPEGKDPAAPAEPEKPAASAEEQPEDPAAAEAAREAEMQQYMENLESYYGVEEDLANELLSDPVKAIPRLAAQLHVGIFDSISQTFNQVMEQQLPQMVSEVQRVNEARQEVWGEYQKSWPDLTDKQLHPVIQEEFDRVFSDPNNAGKSREELIHKVGVNTWLRSGRDPGELAVRLHNQEAGGAQPPQQQGGERVEPMRTDFRPAPTGPGAPPAPQREENVFAQIALEGDD